MNTTLIADDLFKIEDDDSELTLFDMRKEEGLQALAFESAVKRVYFNVS